MTGVPGLGSVAVRALHSPSLVIRAARTQKLRVAIVVSRSVPGPVRRGVFRMVASATDRVLRRPGEHAVAAPIRVLASGVLGDGSAAAELASRSSASASPRTVVRLARVMLASGDAAAAGRLLATRVAGAGDSEAILRAEIDYRLGRFAAAVEILRPLHSRRPGDWQVGWIKLQSEAELAMLDPGWRPELGPADRDAGPRPDQVKGRVLHLLTNSLPYRQAGYTVRSQSVARAQIDQGIDPQMVTRAGFPANMGVWGAATREVVDGVTYHRLRPDLAPGMPVDQVATETARALIPLIDSLRPSLLQPTTNYVNAQVALALGERLGLPVVYEVRGLLEETWLSRVGDVALEGDRYVAARAIETEAMRRSTGIVTLSETMRTDILSRGGIDPNHVTVVPNAVDLTRFTPGPRDEALAHSLGIDPGEVVLGYISSFTSYEGIVYLVEAAAELRRRGRRIRLLLVGDGEERDNLESAVARTGLRDDGWVIFTGRVPHSEIDRYYRTIDVFVVPRTDDRVSRLVTPLKPYEAMAMEKAVVVSAVGALLEIVEEDVTGRSFRPEDAIDLADTIEPLLDDPAVRARLGTAARAWVAANRTWAQNGIRYRELYERLGVV